MRILQIMVDGGLPTGYDLMFTFRLEILNNSLNQSISQERPPSSNLTPDQLFFVAFSQVS